MTDLRKALPRTSTLSVIVPTLNEAHAIGETLDAIARLRPVAEVIVVDGGSHDDTARVARERGAQVIVSERGRGRQMAVGAREAAGDTLWFLHADTRPPDDAVETIALALGDHRVVGGNFGVVFDGDQRAARFLTWLYPKLRLLGLCYGDSAFFVRRDAYDAVGGFRPYPIFEDLDLVRRLRRRGRFVQVPSTVVTSSRRFEGRSFALTFLRWASLQVLYWLGVPPDRLGAFYAHVRTRAREGGANEAE